MDGDSKEEFCTTCSVEVPSAFRNDNDEKKNKKTCHRWSKYINILLWVIIFIVLIYFIFKKN